MIKVNGNGVRKQRRKPFSRKLGALNRVPLRVTLARTSRLEILEDRRVLADFSGIGTFVRGELLEVQQAALVANNGGLDQSLPVVGDVLKKQASTGSILTSVTNAFGTVVDNTMDINSLISNLQTAFGTISNGDTLSLEDIGNDSVRLQYTASSTFTVGGFDSLISIVPISTNAFDVKVNYSLDVTFGVDATGFFLDGSKTAEELVINASVADAELPQLQVALGTLSATATPFADLQPAFEFTLHSNLVGNEIYAADPIVITSVTSGNVDVDADLKVTYPIAGVTPELTADFGLTWDLGSLSNNPTVTFANVQLELGKVFDAFGGEIIRDVLQQAEPVFRLAQRFEDPLPGLSQLSAQIESLTGDLDNFKTGINEVDSIISLFADPTLRNLLSGAAKSGLLSAEQSGGLKAFIEVVDTVNEIGAFAKEFTDRGSLFVTIGSYTLGSSASDLRSVSGPLSSIVPTTDVDATAFSNAINDIKSFMDDNNLKSDLLNVEGIFELLTGSDAVTILEYDRMLVDDTGDTISVASVDFVNTNFAIGIVPANFQVRAEVGIGGHIRFGVDTRGFMTGNLADGLFIGAGSAADPFFSLTAGIFVELAVGSDLELIDARVGVSGVIEGNTGVYFVGEPVTPDRLYVDQFSSPCVMQGTLTLDARVDLFAAASLNFDLQAIINTAKQLLEAAIRNNPTVFVAKEMFNAARPLLQKAVDAGFVSETDLENLETIVNDPTKGLRAIADGFDALGAKASVGFQDAADKIAEGGKEFTDGLKDGANTVFGEGNVNKGQEILDNAGVGGLFLAGGSTTLVDDRSTLFERRILEWRTNQCGVTDRGGDGLGSSVPAEQTPEAVLGELNESVLTLYVGDLASRRSVEPNEINEDVLITPTDTGVIVRMFGNIQTFDGVERIVANAGDGENSIDATGVHAELLFIGGENSDAFTAGLRSATFLGGSGLNRLVGSPENDSLFGGRDRDEIQGLEGDDFISGEGGNDILVGDFFLGSAEDTNESVSGGNDIIRGGNGDDQAYGGRGEDDIDGGDGNNTLLGGDGNDVIRSGDGNNRIEGNEGNDELFSGLGNSVLNGGIGNDRINAGTGVNILVGGMGNDLVVGGEAGDFFVHSEGEIGADTYDGAGGQDTLLFFANNAGTNFAVSPAGSQVSVRGDYADGEFSLQLLGVHQILASISGGESTVSVQDAPDTELTFVGVDLGAASNSDDLVTFLGTPRADQLSVARNNRSAEFALDLVGGATSLRIFNSTSDDSLIVQGLEGDDQITAESGVENSIAIRFEGGLGDDFLQGAAGADHLEGNEGNDTFVGGTGDDIFDGGNGFDTILISGTPGSDVIDIHQSDATTMRYILANEAHSDTLIAGTVESVRVETGDGADAITVRQANSLTAANSLRMEIVGKATFAPEDRLYVVDDGRGDLVLLRQDADGTSGSFTVGSLSPIVFSGVAYSTTVPRYTFTAGTGADSDGRLVVFRKDTFENNNTIPNAAHLGGGNVINASASIDPGVITAGTIPDIDWFQLIARDTGTLDVHLLFEQVPFLSNGNPGLPGNGDLMLRVVDEGGNLIGESNSSTNNERLTFPVVQDTVYFVGVSGATDSALNTYDLMIENEPVPVPSVVDLVSSSDTGRSDSDNVTKVNTAEFDVYLDDDRLSSFVNLGLVADAIDNDLPDSDFGIELFNNDTSLGFAFYTGVGNRWRFNADVGDLQEGHANFVSAAVWVKDRLDRSNVGRGMLSESLNVTLDTLAPVAPTIDLDPSVTDTGVSTNTGTLTDRITRQETPGFVGVAEANSLVRLYAGVPIGMTVASPIDGDETFAIGQYRSISTANLNASGPRDGLRQITVTAEDLAGNVSGANSLDFLLDTSPPRIDGVDFADGTTVFASKPDLAPSPATESLLVTFVGGPSAVAGLFAPAVDLGMATDIRNYQIVGDHGGNVLIDNAQIVSQSPEQVVVRVQFSGFLPDDRYTLTLDDSISDAAGNLLDGDSSAQAPGTPAILFPSGNGTPGGNFVARFTVDSRPEFGVISQGLVYVDINGNHIFDPEGQDNDATNRDFVMQFGGVADAHFAGNFADTTNGVASGFDKLGSYGRFNGTYSFLLDTNDDGVGDFASVMPNAFQVNGIPVAGNFNAANDGDEIGLFDGQAWYLDTNGNNRIDTNERIAANYNGIPIVGDFNGDGNDDLAVYVNDTNQFIFDTNRDGQSDHTWDAKDDVERFAGLSGFTDKPVVGDINLDGIDDIGLWGKGRQGVLPKESGEFFFWVSDRVSNDPANVFDAYSPAPLGNDTFALFGDETALPIFGNFDPPAASSDASSNLRTLTNSGNAFDVNNDGSVTALDALTVINAMNRGITEVKPSQSARMYAMTGSYLDVNGSEDITALDALMIINELNRQGSANAGEGEQNSNSIVKKSHERSVDLAFSASLDDEDSEEDPWFVEELYGGVGMMF